MQESIPPRDRIATVDTKQLIVLWLGGLAVAVLLALRGGTAGHAGAICVLCALLIYSFGAHPAARKKWVPITVVIVAGCGATAFYVHKAVRTREMHRRQEQADAAAERDLARMHGYAVNPGSIKLSGVKYSPFSMLLRGRVQNGSGKPLAGLTIDLTFLDGHGVLDEERCDVRFAYYDTYDDYAGVPAGETRGFQASCPAIIDAPHGEHVFLRSRVTSATTLTP